MSQPHPFSLRLRRERTRQVRSGKATLANIQIRDGITFEWLDDPSTPNPRWRARMSRQVFAALVEEKLGADHGDSFHATPSPATPQVTRLSPPCRGTKPKTKHQTTK
jgi:hypothetical protein